MYQPCDQVINLLLLEKKSMLTLFLGFFKSFLLTTFFRFILDKIVFIFSFLRGKLSVGVIILSIKVRKHWKYFKVLKAQIDFPLVSRQKEIYSKFQFSSTPKYFFKSTLLKVLPKFPYISK